MGMIHEQLDTYDHEREMARSAHDALEQVIARSRKAEATTCVPEAQKHRIGLHYDEPSRSWEAWALTGEPFFSRNRDRERAIASVAIRMGLVVL